MPTVVDHLVYACTHVQRGTEYLENLLGVEATLGGSHPNLGTCNTLFSLGDECYLEVIGPDPEQASFDGTRPFGIDTIESDQLVAWVARRSGLDTFRNCTLERGVELSEPMQLSRRTPDGELLEWEMSFINGVAPQALSVLPLLIDWGSSPNPAARCRGGAQLKSLEIEYPDIAYLQTLITALELDVRSRQATAPCIRALISSPNGDIELKSGV